MNTKDILKNYQFHCDQYDKIKKDSPNIYKYIDTDLTLDQIYKQYNIMDNFDKMNNKLKAISSFKTVQSIGYYNAMMNGLNKDEFGNKVILSKYNKYNLYTSYIVNNDNSITTKQYIRLTKKLTEQDIKETILERLKDHKGYDCVACNEMFDENKHYVQHCESSKHKKKVYGLDTMSGEKCTLCDVTCSNIYRHIRSYNHTIKYIMKYIIFDEQKEVYTKLYHDIFGHQEIDHINFYSEKSKYNLIKFMELIRINTGDIPRIFTIMNSKVLYKNVKNKKFVGKAVPEIDFIDMYDENINIPYNYKYMFEHDVQKTKDNKFEFQSFTQYAEMYINKFYDSIDNYIKNLLNIESELKKDLKINEHLKKDLIN